MIQALRDLIDLYTFYFETLERFLDGLLDLLCVCICQGAVVFSDYYDIGLRVFLCRKRYFGKNWNGMSSATTGKQCEEAQCGALGTCCYDLRQTL
jgi:Sec7-like guanine-nucleotide exchange factor